MKINDLKNIINSYRVNNRYNEENTSLLSKVEHELALTSLEQFINMRMKSYSNTSDSLTAEDVKSLKEIMNNRVKYYPKKKASLRVVPYSIDELYKTISSNLAIHWIPPNTKELKLKNLIKMMTVNKTLAAAVLAKFDIIELCKETAHHKVNFIQRLLSHPHSLKIFFSSTIGNLNDLVRLCEMLPPVMRYSLLASTNYLNQYLSTSKNNLKTSILALKRILNLCNDQYEILGLISDKKRDVLLANSTKLKAAYTKRIPIAIIANYNFNNDNTDEVDIDDDYCEAIVNIEASATLAQDKKSNLNMTEIEQFHKTNSNYTTANATDNIIIHDPEIIEDAIIIDSLDTNNVGKLISAMETCSEITEDAIIIDSLDNNDVGKLISAGEAASYKPQIPEKRKADAYLISEESPAKKQRLAQSNLIANGLFNKSSLAPLISKNDQLEINIESAQLAISHEKFFEAFYYISKAFFIIKPEMFNNIDKFNILLELAIQSLNLMEKTNNTLAIQIRYETIVGTNIFNVYLESMKLVMRNIISRQATDAQHTLVNKIYNDFYHIQPTFNARSKQ